MSFIKFASHTIQQFCLIYLPISKWFSLQLHEIWSIKNNPHFIYYRFKKVGNLKISHSTGIWQNEKLQYKVGYIFRKQCSKWTKIVTQYIYLSDFMRWLNWQQTISYNDNNKPTYYLYNNLQVVNTKFHTLV